MMVWCLSIYKAMMVEVTAKKIMLANGNGGSTRDRSLIRIEIGIIHGVPSNHMIQLYFELNTSKYNGNPFVKYVLYFCF